jgi:ABC-2 type transporter
MFIATGLYARNAQAAQGMALILVPFTFVSSAYVPVSSMPNGLRAAAAQQPVTYMIEAVRSLSTGDRMVHGPEPLLAEDLGDGALSEAGFGRIGDGGRVSQPYSTSASRPSRDWPTTDLGKVCDMHSRSPAPVDGDYPRSKVEQAGSRLTTACRPVGGLGSDAGSGTGGERSPSVPILSTLLAARACLGLVRAAPRAR